VVFGQLNALQRFMDGKFDAIDKRFDKTTPRPTIGGQSDGRCRSTPASV
jgi:hypothetical protein